MARLRKECYCLILISLGIFGCKHDRNKLISRPNVVLIIADDQGWGDISSNGNSVLSTPVLDQLAKDGATFVNFYVSPLCAPTRASLLTGRHYLRTGTSWVSKGNETMRSSEVTIAELFKGEGYHTGCFGKWHNGAHYPENPSGQGFDEFLGFCAGHWNNYFNTSLEHNGKMESTKGYITDVLTDAAMTFIDQHKNENFFCYIPYNVPHSPHQLPDKYFNEYKAKGLDDELASVYGMLANMDENIGRVLKKLDDLGVSDNTIVIFLSDNGPNANRFNGGMRGIKGSVHEGGTRTPFYIKWPGKIDTGRQVDAIAAHIDIMPTLAALCSLQIPETLSIDGEDLTALLTGDDRLERNLFEVMPGQTITPAKGAVRSQTHRLVLNGPDTMLFDVENDRGESIDISKENPDLTHQLIEQYKEWYRSLQHSSVTNIPVGHEQAPVTTLLAPEAKFSEPLRFKEGHGWANDWITNWSTDSPISWEIDVAREENFNVTLLYSCSPDNVGATVTLLSADDKIVKIIDKAFTPVLIESPDRVKRKEAYEQTWGEIEIGTIRLKKGEQSIRLHALTTDGKEVADVKGIVLTQSR